MTCSQKLRNDSAWAAVGIALLLTSTPHASASIMFYDIFKVQDYSQTSTAQPTTPVGFGGFANVNASLASDLTGGTVTSVSPLSPMTLTGSDGNYAFGVGTATKAVLDTDFPNGTTYTFALSGGTFNGQSATVTTPASDAYSSTIPFFTGSTYTALQNFNVATAINLLFNSWTTPNGVNTPLTFIGITQVSNGDSVFGTSGDNTLTGALVPANTLLPGTQYDLDIVYSARLLTANSGFGTGTGFAAYDVRTDLVFTTAALSTAPEPASLGLAGLGALFVAFCGIRQRMLARQV